MKYNRIRGFTLIEIMVVVAIVSILAAIAIPNYRSYVIRSARTSAQTELLQLATLQERIFLNSSAYSTSVTTTYDANATGGLGNASSLTSDGKYTLAIIPASAPAQTYTITAIPVVGKAQAGNGCLTIKDNGLRLWYQTDDNCGVGSPTTPW